jgi:hypothetical protein
MLRVLVHDALATAMAHGFERISFHGYCIEARRFSAAGAERASVDLTLTADGGAEPLDRIRIAVAFRSDRISMPHRSLARAGDCRAPRRVSRWLCQPG